MTSDLDSQRCFLELICAETETQSEALVQKLVETDLIRTTDDLDHSDQMVNQLRVVQTVRCGSFICSPGVSAVLDQNVSTATLRS